jgi:hypothetical protein
VYLEVQPTGGKFWRFRYRQANGKETTITFGLYPEVSLADARNKRTEARRMLLEGQDPIQQREQARRESLRATEYTFRKIATGWHELKVKSWSPAYAHKTGIASRNPVADMKDVLQVVCPSNFPAISSDELPEFLECPGLQSAASASISSSRVSPSKTPS